MNERIKELADKIWEEKYWTNPNTDRLLPAQLNRFAELIVKECVAICNDTNDASYLNGVIAGRKIKQHFGVEL